MLNAQRETKKSNGLILVKTRMGVFGLEINMRGIYALRLPVFPRIAKRATSGVSVERCPLTVAPAEKCLSPLFTELRKLSLDLRGYTLFQRKVYAALMKVPAGMVVTYGELAKRAGYPGAARAVGTAMKKNRLPIVIPCHRVIPATGGLGGYSAGKTWKRWLLEYEKAIRATRNAQRLPAGS